MLYGRDAELAVIGAVIDDARAGRSRAIVVRGAPGVGKTALLEAARARAGGLAVLSARGVEAESELPFAGLHQLLRPALGRLGALPEPQRLALESALGLGAAGGHERFLVYAACLTLLAEVADAGPVLCLVDDAHWLDTASAEALEFVARRLDREGLAMVLAARDGDVRRFHADGLADLHLAPLDAEASARLLRRTTDADAAVTERLLAQARGNPLALIELPRALTDAQLTGTEALPEQLPMTAQLEAAFSDRVERLPDPTRRLLLVAAADDAEDMRVVARAAVALGLDAGQLGPAERAGLVSVEGHHLAFRHPLVRSAVYGSATAAERQGVHRALADALAGDDQQVDRRVWHLAAAAASPDAAIVHELDDLATRAEARGATAAAARALQRAADLSTDAAERTARLVRAARDLSLAGRDEQAVALAARADDRALSPSGRKELVLVRAIAANRGLGLPAQVVPELLEVSRELARTDPGMAMQVLVHAATAAWQAWDQAALLEIAEVAALVPVDRLDDASRAFARTVAGFAAMAAGRRDEAERLLGASIAWGAAVDEPLDAYWASWAAVLLGDDESFALLLQRAAGLARRRGEIGALTDVLGMQAVHLAVLAQRYDEAGVAAAEALQLARELRADGLVLLPRAAMTIVAAVRGDDDEARRHGGEVVRLARARGNPMRASPAVYGLALLDMAASRWEDALDRLEQIADPNDPAFAITAPEVVEAAVRAGHPDRARRAFAGYEARARYAPADSIQARLAGCRALLASGDEATEHYQEALGHLDAARPFDRPRTSLLEGEHLRRAGRRADARVHLRRAVDGFDDLGAVDWAERARAELRATGETARRRSPGPVTQLTPQELQIAGLVAQGLTNKEVATQLYLSPRTVDAHLRSVFAKLGVASRREVGAALSAPP